METCNVLCTNTMHRSRFFYHGNNAHKWDVTERTYLTSPVISTTPLDMNHMIMCFVSVIKGFTNKLK